MAKRKKMPVKDGIRYWAVSMAGIEYSFAFVPQDVICSHVGDASAMGCCDVPSEVVNPQILVDDSLTGRKRLGTILHEMLHAADIHKTEDWVASVSDEMERILTDDGWRRHA